MGEAAVPVSIADELPWGVRANSTLSMASADGRDGEVPSEVGRGRRALSRRRRSDCAGLVSRGFDPIGRDRNAGAGDESGELDPTIVWGPCRGSASGAAESGIGAEEAPDVMVTERWLFRTRLLRLTT